MARGLKQELSIRPDALGRQIVERNLAQSARILGELELESGRELERAQHSQAVLNVLGSTTRSRRVSRAGR